MRESLHQRITRARARGLIDEAGLLARTRNLLLLRGPMTALPLPSLPVPSRSSLLPRHPLLELTLLAGPGIERVLLARIHSPRTRVAWIALSPAPVIHSAPAPALCPTPVLLASEIVAARDDFCESSTRAPGARGPSDREEGESACRGRRGEGSASPASFAGAARAMSRPTDAGMPWLIGVLEVRSEGLRLSVFSCPASLPTASQLATPDVSTSGHTRAGRRLACPAPLMPWVQHSGLFLELDPEDMEVAAAAWLATLERFLLDIPSMQREGNPEAVARGDRSEMLKRWFPPGAGLRQDWGEAAALTLLDLTFGELIR